MKINYTEKLCFKCLEEKENVNVYEIKGRGYESDLFDTKKHTLQLCDCCKEEQLEEWFNEKPNMIDICLQEYKYEEDIENWVNENLNMQGRELFWNRTSHSPLETQDWIDIEEGITTQWELWYGSDEVKQESITRYEGDESMKFKLGEKVKVIESGEVFEIVDLCKELDKDFNDTNCYFKNEDDWFREDQLRSSSTADEISNHLNRDSLEDNKTTAERLMDDIRRTNPNKNGNVQFGDVSAKGRKKLYHIGDIMIAGNQINRLCELQDLSDLDLNIDCYSAMLNEKINDKSGLTEEQNNKLAEHIYQADIDRLFDADIIVGEILPSSIGSMCEMAMLDGFKFAAEKIEGILENNVDGDINSIVDDVIDLKDKLKKDIYYHSFDLRNTDLKESGWRRSHSINQLLYAFIMHSATDSDLLTWKQILNKLEQRYK